MTHEEKIVNRILNVLPTRQFELSTFFSLFNVRLSDKVETACVTCGAAPELLLNADFIAEHCKTDEHLFMLVMHELYHLILGHTKLFPKPTPARNIAFDAVINALLCSLFPEPEFTSFFTDYYPPDKMPFALLRPKGANTPAAAESALRLLYDEAGTGTYYDVFSALVKMPDLILLRGKDEGDGDIPVLLGSHGEDGKENEMSREMEEYISEVISKWPSPDKPLCGRDQGSGLRKRDFSDETAASLKLKEGVRRLMRLAKLHATREIRKRCVANIPSFTETFIPDSHDRFHEAKELVLGQALVYTSSLRAKHPAHRDNAQTYIYLDVSGSVTAKVPSVAKILLAYLRRKECRIHVFSTAVAATTIEELSKHVFYSTGGTNINCVAEDILALPHAKRPRSIVVITDGYTGPLKPSHVARLKAAGIRLFVGLVEGDGVHSGEKDLKDVASLFVKLY